MKALDLVSMVKQEVSIPEYQPRFTNDGLLLFADSVISGQVVPLLMSLNQELFVRKDTVPIVAGRAEYPIPSRAMGRVLRGVFFRSEAASKPVSLSQIPSEDQFESDVSGFCFEGDSILLNPARDSGSLILSYLARVSKLTTTQYAEISSVNGSTLTLKSPLPGATTTMLVDVVKGRPGHTLLAIDASVSNVNGLQIELTNDASTMPPCCIQAGDFLCVAGYSPVLGLPEELTPLVAKGVVVKVLEAQGDVEMLGAAQGQFKALLENVKSVCSPRLIGSPQKLTSTLLASRRM